MNSTLIPVQGCLIKLEVNGGIRYGVVSKVKNKNYIVGQEIVLRNNNKLIRMAASAAAKSARSNSWI